MDPLPATGSFLPLIAAEIYEARIDLQSAFPDSHTALSPIAYWRWFCRHAGVECDIEFLIDRFRRTLTSNSIINFTAQVTARLDEQPLRFLGDERASAAALLDLRGDRAAAEALLEAEQEWFIFSDIGAAFEIYRRRDGIQKTFPDILGVDHNAFCQWLIKHGSEEHGCSPVTGEKLRRCKSTETLARIYSFAVRREDVGQLCEQHLLAENPGDVIRSLIRGAGDGLEYDLDDVVVLTFIHQTQRHLLVPLYLELPGVRRRPQASRTAEFSLGLLPEDVRQTDWARQGCKAHEGYFNEFVRLLDDEMHHWAADSSSPSRHVLGVLRNVRRRSAFSEMVKPAYRAAIRRLPYQPAADLTHWKDFGEKERRPAVNLFGYFHSDIGIGESSRGLAQSISILRPLSCVPLHTSQIRAGTELPQMFQCFEHLSDTNVFVSYPHQHEDLLGLVRPEYTHGRQNIAHLAWEQKDANPWWKAIYGRYDEIWTISKFAARPFIKMFPGRVRVVPNVVDVDLFPNCDDAEAGRLIGDRLNFLFVFDANSSIERKNPEGLIGAFISAFEGTRHAERVCLTLKVGGMHRAEHAARVERLMRQAGRSKLAIRFDGRQLPRNEMLRLIGQADCYVSLHRAEGFGYTMAEAMAYGVPVIASGYSGNLEYMTSESSFLVPCCEAFVKAADGPFQRGSVWGEPDINVAADLMRAVAERPAEAVEIGKRGRAVVRDKLNAKVVAETIRPCFEPRENGGLRLAAD